MQRMQRRFELTISVWFPQDAPLPNSYNEWIEYAFDTTDAPMGITRLERVVETLHPPRADVVFKRREQDKRHGLSRVWT